MIPVIGKEAVLAAVSPEAAIERVRDAFVRHARGEWQMPPKVYLESPPHGDFRAMPARGGGLALVKWVTSFPRNVDRGLPAVRGVVLLSDAETGEELAIIDCRAITWLRTGAAAAIATSTLALRGAAEVGVIGCGANGAWAARCLARAGFGPGVCHDARPEAARELAAELRWRVGRREEAASRDVVVTCTTGEEPVLFDSDLRSGQHIAALGADAHGKAEIDRKALRRCRLFCDEWEQASSGGELSESAARGTLKRWNVTELGAVLIGAASGRQSEREITLFDSTGLAIQDLAIAAATYEAWKDGHIEAPTVSL